MSTILAYAVSVFISLGIMTTDQARSTTNLTIVERDGKTVVIDSFSHTEVIVY